MSNPRLSKPPQKLLLSGDVPNRWLTFEETATLAQVAQDEKKIEQMLVELSDQLQRLPTPQELARRALGPHGTVEELQSVRSRAKRAMTLLVRMNYRLVVKDARRLERTQAIQNMDDLMQEGLIGLMQAIEKYDPKKGVMLSTYANFWINTRTKRWYNKANSLIHVPEPVREVNVKAYMGRSKLVKEFGEDPSMEEVAAFIGASKTSLEKATDAIANSQVATIDSYATGDATTDKTIIFHDLEDTAMQQQKMLADDIKKMLADVLSEKESRAVNLRYGLEDGVARSTYECGRILGVSAQYVRKLCDKAFAKMRGSPHAAALSEYLASVS
jgi:RNA polymerase primary sigma factor